MSEEENILVIDINLLPQDFSINELLTLIKISRDYNLPFDDSDVDYDKLQSEKFIKIIKNDDGELPTYFLRQKAIDLIDSMVGREVPSTKSTKKSTNVDLLTRIPEYRAKWKGLKPGSMGSGPSCRAKLTRWMQENPTYTFDEILKAADHYIDSLNGDYRFLQRADYFIYKQENNREESSRLSAHIDEIDMGGGQTGDWTTKLN